MSEIPNAAMYRWTSRDVEQAKTGVPVLTPYEIPSSSLNNPRETTAGTCVPLALDQFKNILAVHRFDLGDDFFWEEVPPAAEGARTLAELCIKLRKLSSSKYPDRFYKIEDMNQRERAQQARLLFEYWGNTDYRYAIAMGGAFNWSFLDDNHEVMSLLAIKGKYSRPDGKGGSEIVEERIKYIPVAREGAHAGAVAPGAGAQTIKLPDPALSRLDADLTEIRLKTNRIWHLLKQSELVLNDRLLCVRRLTALRTLIQACAPLNHHDTKLRDLTQRVFNLEKQADKELKSHKTSEVLQNGHVDAEMERLIHKKLGFVDDIAAAVQSLVADICGKLVDDTAFAGRCSKFARDVLEKKLTGSPDYMAKRDKIIVALVDAAIVLQETKTPDGFSDKVLQILKQVPDAPITSVSGLVEGTAMNSLFSLLGTRAAYGVTYAKLVGAAASVATGAAVGNLAGPSNAYIAWTQWRAWNRAQACFDSAKGDLAKVEQFLNETMELLRRGLLPEGHLKENLEKAFASGNQSEFDKLKKPLLDEFSGTFQAKNGAKSFALVLQVVALAMAYSAFLKDEQDGGKPGANKHIVTIDVVNLVCQGEMTVVGAIDVFAAIANLQKLSRAIGVAGMYVGSFTAFVGLGVAIFQLDEAEDKISGGLAVAGILGNLSIVIAGACWIMGTPVPGFQVAGMGILVAATLVGGIQTIIEASKSKASTLALLVIDSLEHSPSYQALMADATFKSEMDALKEACGDFLPSPRNNQFVYDALLGVGFRREHIDMIVEHEGATLLPAGSLMQ